MSLQKVPVLYRLLKKAICEDCCIILDLEDTLDSTDKKKSRALKQWGRDELIKFAKLYPDFFKTSKIGIRVNSIKSRELEKDLKALAEASKVWDFFCIIGPKIETPEDICHFVNFLKIHKVRYKTFIPIIETIKGFENLSSIVASKSLTYAIYGHNDYSLESKHYPFLEQDETGFWKIVSHFIKKVETKKIHYIHTPLFHFADKLLAYQVYLQLQKRCSLPFGMVTINSFQTSLFNQIKYSNVKIKIKRLKKRIYSLKEKKELALQLKNIFSNKERNFKVNLKTKKFYSPHEHIAAIKFLEKFT